MYVSSTVLASTDDFTHLSGNDNNHLDINLTPYRLTSANDLRDIAISLEIDSRKERKDTGSVNEKYKDLVAPERKEDIY